MPEAEDTVAPGGCRSMTLWAEPAQSIAWIGTDARAAKPTWRRPSVASASDVCAPAGFRSTRLPAVPAQMHACARDWKMTPPVCCDPDVALANEATAPDGWRSLNVDADPVHDAAWDTPAWSITRPACWPPDAPAAADAFQCVPSGCRSTTLVALPFQREACVSMTDPSAPGNSADPTCCVPPLQKTFDCVDPGGCRLVKLNWAAAGRARSDATAAIGRIRPGPPCRLEWCECFMASFSTGNLES